MEEQRKAAERAERQRKRQRRRSAAKAWKYLRPVTVLLISLGICAAVMILGVRFVDSRFIQPVDINDATPVEVTISSGSGASLIAKRLYEAGGVDEDGELLAPGLIKSKTVFKIYVDFTGKSNKLKAGTYILSRNMDIGQIVDVICEGNPPRTTLKLVITEGMTVEDIADKLVELGVLKTAEEFLSLCRTGEEFAGSYAVLSALAESAAPGRDYMLEGYLFPDTYEIYSDESAKSIINRLLYRFVQMMTDANIARAAELGMSIDDVIRLASVIEKEAKVEKDFARVSAVFHNRLKNNMKLESDAPLKYIFKTTGVVTFTQAQKDSDSLYNTYMYAGLPVGPICNPGMKAISAALYPDEEYEDYLFFCLQDKDSGTLVFAKTNEEHEENVAKFSPYW